MKYNLNSHKLFYHLPVLNRWQRGEEIFPVFVEISPIGACNQRCVFCAYEYLEKNAKKIDRKRLLEILKEMSTLGVKSIFFSGEGEPLMHNEVPDIIVEAKEMGLDIALNTNGMLMNEDISRKILDKLSWIRWSINAGNDESYQKIHRVQSGSFNKVMNNLKKAVAVKKEFNSKTTIGVQLVYVGQPIEELLCLTNLLKSIGVDYFSIKPFNKHPLERFAMDMRPGELEKIEALSKLSTEEFRVVAREGFLDENITREYKHCLALPFFAEIKCDGELYPCGPLLGMEGFSYGNIYKAGFEEIWRGRQRREVLDKIMCSKDLKECMPNCRLNQINKFLWSLKNEPLHVNFI